MPQSAEPAGGGNSWLPGIDLPGMEVKYKCPVAFQICAHPKQKKQCRYQAEIPASPERQNPPGNPEVADRQFVKAVLQLDCNAASWVTGEIHPSVSSIQTECIVAAVIAVACSLTAWRTCGLTAKLEAR